MDFSAPLMDLELMANAEVSGSAVADPLHCRIMRRETTEKETMEELTKSERKQIAEMLDRRANEIAEFSGDYRKDGNHFGSVELALSREIERLRRLADRVNPPEPEDDDAQRQSNRRPANGRQQKRGSMSDHEQQTKPDGGASALTDGFGGMRPEAWMYKNANTADWYFRWKKAEDRLSVLLHSGSQLVSHSMVAADAARKEAIKRCIEIVETYRVSVGNSASGELAAEWTMENLREIRDEMRALIEPDLTPNVELTGAHAKEAEEGAALAERPPRTQGYASAANNGEQE